MEKDYSNIDVRTCSREDCEMVLAALRRRLLVGQDDRLGLIGEIMVFQKKLTQFRINNIKLMVGSRAPGPSPR